MTDLSHPSGAADANSPDKVAALFTRHPSVLPQDGRDAAVTLITDATFAMAAMKNIPLTAEHSRQLAEGTAASLSATLLRGLLDAEAKAVSFTGRSVNHLLDTIAAMRALHFMWAVQGQELDAGSVSIHAREWVNRFAIANNMRDACYRWPSPAEMAAEYYKARPSAPVAIRGAQRQAVRARYYVGGANDTSNSGIASWLLMRCPSLPGISGAVVPHTVEAGHV